VRALRFAEGCGCAITSANDFHMCPLGHLYCTKQPGHAVTCPKCGHVYGRKDMTKVGDRRFCPRCLGRARWQYWLSIPWRGMVALLSWLGR